ncbi:MAG: glycosyl transferase [Desulfobacteraceae bacterium IS3]|nr:MAG: glycosyl transferase [Desulfobacteraceae bacterium IS3]HAO22598.1 glycosyl transferase [Desulfobacteraceae bacterium]
MMYAAMIAFALCVVLTPLVKKIAAKRGWMAYPVKDRWHKQPTALMGGIAIYAAMSIPLLMSADFASILPHLSEFAEESALPSASAVLWIGATLLFILGIIDDFYRIRPQTKLVGQILVASLVAFLGFRLQWFGSLTLDTLVTIFWIVGITNAFNLIDNMDGLCAGVGCVASAYLAFLFAGNQPEAAIAALSLAGALAGFLIYNFNPASIFMGDCGSLVIGFSLSMLGIYYAQNQAPSRLAAYSVPIMVMMVPILDTTLVTFIRILSGRKASVGGRDHTSHRLVLVGLSEKGAVCFLYGVGAISGISAVFVSQNDTLTSPAVIIPLLLAMLLMGIYLAQLRIYPEKEFSVLREKVYTPILMELTYKRQILLVALDFWLIAFSYYLSYRLRFSGEDFVYFFRVFLRSLPAVIAFKFIALFATGIYRGFWRFMSTDDVFTYIKASFFATLLSIAAVTFIYRFEDFSKGIFVIDWLLTTGLLLGTRGSFRMSLDSFRRRTLEGETVLIYGAGRGGEILLRELINNKKRHIKPIGLIDDEPLKIGKKIQGYPILGGFNDIQDLLEKYRFTGILISFNSNEPNNIEGAKAFCKKHHLFLKRFSIRLEDVDTEAEEK